MESMNCVSRTQPPWLAKDSASIHFGCACAAAVRAMRETKRAVFRVGGVGWNGKL
jgi:hypothetical protein